MDIVTHGLYILSDDYFAKYDTGRMMDNKSENRPHYFSVMVNDVLWMIPISHQVDKYKKKIENFQGKDCLFYHIGKIAGRECAFLIGDMIPVAEKHIARAYTVSKRPYVVRDEDLNRKLTSKAVRYLLLARKGVIKPYVDIFKIEKDIKS